jgi:hypothetical protein
MGPCCARWTGWGGARNDKGNTKRKPERRGFVTWPQPPETCPASMSSNTHTKATSSRLARRCSLLTAQLRSRRVIICPSSVVVQWPCIAHTHALALDQDKLSSQQLTAWPAPPHHSLFASPENLRSCQQQPGIIRLYCNSNRSQRFRYNYITIVINSHSWKSEGLGLSVQILVLRSIPEPTLCNINTALAPVIPHSRLALALPRPVPIHIQMLSANDIVVVIARHFLCCSLPFSLS